MVSGLSASNVRHLEKKDIWIQSSEFVGLRLSWFVEFSKAPAKRDADQKEGEKSGIDAQKAPHLELENEG